MFMLCRLGSSDYFTEAYCIVEPFFLRQNALIWQFCLCVMPLTTARVVRTLKSSYSYCNKMLNFFHLCLVFLFIEQICNRLLDMDEKVRLEALLIVFEAAMENFASLDEKV